MNNIWVFCKESTNVKWKRENEVKYKYDISVWSFRGRWLKEFGFWLRFFNTLQDNTPFPGMYIFDAKLGVHAMKVGVMPALSLGDGSQQHRAACFFFFLLSSMQRVPKRRVLQSSFPRVGVYCCCPRRA